MNGMRTRWRSRCDSIACTTASKSARIGNATATRSATRTRRLLIVVSPLREVGNAELAFERGDLCDADRANEIHERQLARLGGDDHQPAYGLGVAAARVDVDLRALAIALFYHPHALPGPSRLAAHARDDVLVVFTVLLEFVAAHVDAFELRDDVVRRALIGIVGVEKLRRHLQQIAVECDVDGLPGFVREAGKVDVQLLPAGGRAS